MSDDGNEPQNPTETRNEKAETQSKPGTASVPHGNDNWNPPYRQPYGGRRTITTSEIRERESGFVLRQHEDPQTARLQRLRASIKAPYDPEERNIIPRPPTTREDVLERHRKRTSPSRKKSNRKRPHEASTSALPPVEGTPQNDAATTIACPSLFVKEARVAAQTWLDLKEGRSPRSGYVSTSPRDPFHVPTIYGSKLEPVGGYESPSGTMGGTQKAAQLPYQTSQKAQRKLHHSPRGDPGAQ